MANFSSNAVRHLYVVPTGASITDVALATSATKGSLAVRSSNEDVWFEYASPNFQGIVRSDLINKNKITSMKDVPGTPKIYKAKKISLSPDYNGGNPIAGQSYGFNIRFYGMGIGGNDIQYNIASGMYTATTTSTPRNVYEALEALINKSLAKEPEKWIKVEGVASGINIYPVIRPFALGKKTGDPVRFEVSIIPVMYNDLSINWALDKSTGEWYTEFPGLYKEDYTTLVSSGAYTNGRAVADMEWFYYGERNDGYRVWEYPENFDSKYLANPGDGTNTFYDFVEVEFYYSGNAEDVQRSTKQLTLAVQKVNATTSHADYANLLGFLGL